MTQSELTKALVNFHKEVGTIHKNANAQYGKFADLANVLSTVIPPLANNGLVLTQSFEPSEGLEPNLVTTLRHVSGDSIESKIPLVVNKGRNILHDTGAAITYLRRYQIVSLLGLVADVDTDGAFVDAPVETKAAKPAEKPAEKRKTSKPSEEDTFRSQCLERGLSEQATSILVGKLNGDFATGIKTLAAKSDDEIAAINQQFS